MSRKGMKLFGEKIRAGAMFALATASIFWAQDQKAVRANVTADLPSGTMQAKATATCLECHEARIILQQRLSKAAWVKEMDKMAKWGAEVDPKDRDALIDYFSANFNPDQSVYDAPKSANESKSKTKPKH